LDGRRLKLGILTNEILDPELSRVGGFGYGALSAATLFASDPSLGVDVAVIACDTLKTSSTAAAVRSGVVRVLLRPSDRGRWVETLAAEPWDLHLCIDYRPSYDTVLQKFSRTPVVIWVRDPRTRADVDRIHTLRLPDGSAAAGLGYGRVPGLRPILLRSLLRRRPIRFAAVYEVLIEKARECYGLPWIRGQVLTNIVTLPASPLEKARQPLVIFLGRLDPVKRPWIALEVARRLPDVAFAFLGQNHFPAAWQPTNIPANAQFLGNVAGAAKTEWLSKAWLLLNPSIHEALPVSFLEALAHRTALVSCHDPAGAVSSFGAVVPQAPGDGMTSIPAYVEAVRTLVSDPSRTTRLGAEGQAWVGRVHSRSAFLDAFDRLCGTMGLRRGVSGRDE
jgi:glycosyltransferase involved in cell wall biosynthesis